MNKYYLDELQMNNPSILLYFFLQVSLVTTFIDYSPRFFFLCEMEKYKTWDVITTGKVVETWEKC